MSEILFITLAAAILTFICVGAIGAVLLNGDRRASSEIDDRHRLERFMKKYQRHVDGDGVTRTR